MTSPGPSTPWPALHAMSGSMSALAGAETPPSRDDGSARSPE